MGANVTMKEVASKLDGLCTTVTTIQSDVGTIKETQSAMREKQGKIDLHLQGIVDPPNLETRLRTYVDDRDAHKQANATQALLQVQEILRLENENAELRLQASIEKVAAAQSQTEKDRNSNHLDHVANNEKINARLTKVERTQYIGYGILIALNILLKFVFAK